MKMNDTPIRTSENYGINSINIDDSITMNHAIKYPMPFSNYSILNNSDVILTHENDICVTNYLNENHKNELTNNSNINLSLTFTASSDEMTVVNLKLNDKYKSIVDKIKIQINSGVNRKILININSNEELAYYHSELIKVVLEENSSAEIIYINDLGNLAHNFISFETELEKNANLTFSIVDFTGKTSVFNYKSELKGESSTSNLGSLYFGNNDATIDLNYLINVYSPNSKTNIDTVGALSGTAKKHFKGTIDLKKGCKNSIGCEDEYCLLLSKTAKSKALPMILCTEEDVEGKHSSSVGKADEKQMFYIMSRGLSYSEALRLMVKAKCDKVLKNIFDDDIKNEILNKIDGKIK